MASEPVVTSWEGEVIAASWVARTLRVGDRVTLASGEYTLRQAMQKADGPHLVLVRDADVAEIMVTAVVRS